jgi:hypothetical protein
VDLLFQKGHGTPLVEMTNGTSVASTTTLANLGATWHAIGNGDDNGDGKSDCPRTPTARRWSGP